MTEHIGELAEQYALGDLEPAERAAVESHILQCGACALRLEEAGDAVLSFAQYDRQHEPPRRLMARLHSSLGFGDAPVARTSWRWSSLGIAAILAIVLAPIATVLVRDITMRSELATEDAVFARIASGSFDHAAFKGRAAARVLYSANGSWYYVIVAHASPGMRVAYVHNGAMEDLGSVAMHGSMGTLYLPVNHKMEELALLQDGKVVADANLVY